jgi:autophagy-related protein 16
MNWARSTFSPDLQYVAAGSVDGSIFIWNARTTALEKMIKHHTAPVSAIEWKQQMISVGWDKMVILWR